MAETEPGRRWRTLDAHGRWTFLESDLPRIIRGQHRRSQRRCPVPATMTGSAGRLKSS